MGRKTRPPRLELTSLMDVMFLVLVFFIYCIFDMAVHRGLKVDLPSAAGAREKGERIVITIRADDTMQLNGLDLDREEIVRRVVSGDRKASLGAGIGLVADLKAAGVEKASFQVKGE